MKTNKGFAPIFIALSILAVLIAGGVVYLVTRTSTPSSKNTQDKIICTQEFIRCPDGVTWVGHTGPNCEYSECPTPKISPTEETVNWKTYRNETYGFEFKYPVDWTYQYFNCNIDGIALCPLMGHSEFNCGQTCGDDSLESPIYFNVVSSDPNKTKGSWTADSFFLKNDVYKEVYVNIVSTFKSFK